MITYNSLLIIVFRNYSHFYTCSLKSNWTVDLKKKRIYGKVRSVSVYYLKI